MRVELPSRANCSTQVVHPLYLGHLQNANLNPTGPSEPGLSCICRQRLDRSTSPFLRLNKMGGSSPCQSSGIRTTRKPSMQIMRSINSPLRLRILILDRDCPIAPDSTPTVLDCCARATPCRSPPDWTPRRAKLDGCSIFQARLCRTRSSTDFSPHTRVMDRHPLPTVPDLSRSRSGPTHPPDFHTLQVSSAIVPQSGKRECISTIHGAENLLA